MHYTYALIDCWYSFLIAKLRYIRNLAHVEPMIGGFIYKPVKVHSLKYSQLKRRFSELRTNCQRKFSVLSGSGSATLLAKSPRRR